MRKLFILLFFTLTYNNFIFSIVTITSPASNSTVIGLTTCKFDVTRTFVTTFTITGTSNHPNSVVNTLVTPPPPSPGFADSASTDNNGNWSLNGVTSSGENITIKATINGDSTTNDNITVNCPATITITSPKMGDILQIDCPPTISITGTVSGINILPDNIFVSITGTDSAGKPITNGSFVDVDASGTWSISLAGGKGDSNIITAYQTQVKDPTAPAIDVTKVKVTGFNVVCCAGSPGDPGFDTLTIALINKYKNANQPINPRVGCCP